MFDFTSTNLEPVSVTPTMQKQWKGTSGWAIFLSVLGFLYVLFSVVTVVASFFILTQIGNRRTGHHLSQEVGIFSVYALVQIVLVVVQFFTYFWQIKFATQIREAMRTQQQVTFERAWQNLRLHFRMSGITAIISWIFLVGLLVHAMRTTPFLFDEM
jgi:hypothetical protein